MVWYEDGTIVPDTVQCLPFYLPTLSDTMCLALEDSLVSHVMRLVYFDATVSSLTFSPQELGMAIQLIIVITE